MENFGRHKYARQLLRNQAYDERLETEEPEEQEDEPSPRQPTSAGASATVSPPRPAVIPTRARN